MSKAYSHTWRTGEFGELAQVKNGYAFKSSEFLEEGYAAVVRMSNLKLGRLDLTDAKYISRELAELLHDFRLQPYDFVFGMSGSLDNYARIRVQDGLCFLNQRVGCLKPTNIADPNFASYLYTSEVVKNEINALAAGAAQLNISGSQVESIQVSIPPLLEQQKIAAILSSVDDMIEKTRAQIDKLKDLKTGMMQELLTKGMGHTEFKDSPVGRIPVGWGLERISTLCTDIVDCVNKTAPTVEYATPYRMIRTTNVRDGVIETDNMRYVTEETYIAWSRRICLEVGDLVFTREAPMGECGLIQDPKGLFLGQRTMLYRVDPERLDNNFLLCSMQSDYVQSQIQDLGGGSTTPHLRVPDCGKILLKIPQVHEQRNISASIKTVVKHIEVQQKKLRQALALKKALMQDLLTGKVRVKLDQPETTAA